VWTDRSTTSQRTLVCADIPGLLEGAHEGVGLGHAFLRHVSRCRLLVHLVDGSAPDPVGDFKAICEELELFDPALALKPQVVALNKLDIPEVEANKDALLAALRQEAGHTRVVAISAATGGEPVADFMRKVAKLHDAEKANEAANGGSAVGAPSAGQGVATSRSGDQFVDFSDEDAAVDAAAATAEERGVTVTTHYAQRGPSRRFLVESSPEFPGQWRVLSPAVERMVAMTMWDYREALERFQRAVVALGIVDAVLAGGAQAGDIVMIGNVDFQIFEDGFWPVEVVEADAAKWGGGARAGETAVGGTRA